MRPQCVGVVEIEDRQLQPLIEFAVREIAAATGKRGEDTFEVRVHVTSTGSPAYFKAAFEHDGAPRELTVTIDNPDLEANAELGFDHSNIVLVNMNSDSLGRSLVRQVSKVYSETMGTERADFYEHENAEAVSLTAPEAILGEQYTGGECWALAYALHDEYGLPIAAKVERFADGGEYIAHAWVQLPDGRALDINGPVEVDEMESSFGSPGGEVRMFDGDDFLAFCEVDEGDETDDYVFLIEEAKQNALPYLESKFEVSALCRATFTP